VADNPQQTVRELRELVIAYAKQEATEPLTIGALRAMQQYGGRLARGNFTWVPYFVVVIVLVLLAGLVWMARSRKARKTERSSAA
jgi:hypothetical protein